MGIESAALRLKCGPFTPTLPDLIIVQGGERDIQVQVARTVSLILEAYHTPCGGDGPYSPGRLTCTRTFF